MPVMKAIDVDPANVSLTGFASNVTGAGPWTMTTTSSGDGLAHQVSIRNDAATDHSAKTLTLTGTDANGKAQTETLAGPNNAATVESVGYYLTLVTVAVSATIGADTFDVGFVDEVATPIIPLNHYSTTAPTYSVNVTGTIDYTVQECFENVLAGETPLWRALTALTTKTTDLVSAGTRGATGVRLLVNSYTDTAELQLYISQVRE